jgi:hypothetical protein
MAMMDEVGGGYADAYEATLTSIWTHLRHPTYATVFYEQDLCKDVLRDLHRILPSDNKFHKTNYYRPAVLILQGRKGHSDGSSVAFFPKAKESDWPVICAPCKLLLELKSEAIAHAKSQRCQQEVSNRLSPNTENSHMHDIKRTQLVAGHEVSAATQKLLDFVPPRPVTPTVPYDS